MFSMTTLYCRLSRPKAITHQQSSGSHQICYAPPEFTNKQNEVSFIRPDKVTVGSRLDAKAINASLRLFIEKPLTSNCTSKIRAFQRDRCVHDDPSSMRIVFNTHTRRRPDCDRVVIYCTAAPRTQVWQHHRLRGISVDQPSREVVTPNNRRTPSSRVGRSYPSCQGGTLLIAFS